jgi:hypothetical protein
MRRPTMHFRWNYRQDRLHLSKKIVDEIMPGVPLPGLVKRMAIRRRQHGTYVRRDGVLRQTWDHVEGIYFGTLERLSNIFRVRSYLRGDVPTLADFGFFASMFRHFGQDPTPSDLMTDRAPEYSSGNRDSGMLAEVKSAAAWLMEPQRIGNRYSKTPEAHTSHIFVQMQKRRARERNGTTPLSKASSIGTCPYPSSGFGVSNDFANTSKLWSRTLASRPGHYSSHMVVGNRCGGSGTSHRIMIPTVTSRFPGARFITKTHERLNLMQETRNPQAASRSSMRPRTPPKQ